LAGVQLVLLCDTEDQRTDPLCHQLGEDRDSAELTGADSV
jgi:hypothetical protein